MVTPTTYKTDLSIRKNIGFKNMEIGFYVNIMNLFNFKTVQHVYANTGQTDIDDSKEHLENHLKNYPESYRDSFFELYDLINIQHRQHYRSRQGGDLFGRPREIRVGMDISF
jgi:hypothetical protein